MKNDGSPKFEAFRKLQSERAKEAWKRLGVAEKHVASMQVHYDNRRGKTNEELYGEERAKEIEKKMRDAHKLVEFTPEWRENISKGLVGRVISEETRVIHKKNAELRQFGKGPRTPEHQANMIKAQRARMGKDRGSLRGQNFNASCLERDNHTCQACRITQEILTATKKGMSSYLQVHHIKPWEEYPEFQFDVDNGITLCPTCHSRIEAEERRKNLIRTLDKLMHDVFNLCSAYGICEDIEGVVEYDEQFITDAKQSVENLFKILRVNNLKKQFVEDCNRLSIQRFDSPKQEQVQVKAKPGPKQIAIEEKDDFSWIGKIEKYPGMKWFNRNGEEVLPFQCIGLERNS